MSKLYLFFVFLALHTVLGLNSPVKETLKSKLENSAVKRFREYIQINTSQSENLQAAVEFWKRQAEEFGLKFAVHEPSRKPICVLTLEGANTSLPSIMLNSHMDVVPAYPNEWSHPPYAAEVDEDGNIFGRGTQDTKDIAIQYLEAIGRIKRENITLQRTVHMTLMPDEETGAFNGMKPFVKSAAFKNLNLGFALDEGLSSQSDDFYATYQDRRPWFIKFTVNGEDGHGFIMPKDPAIIKLKKLLDVILEYRKTLEEAVRFKTSVEYGNYTTININILKGGSSPNVIPTTFTLEADMRLSPKENASEIMSLINSWAEHAGNGTNVEFIRQEVESLPTPVDDTNPYWIAMKETINELGYEVHPVVCPATSDLVYVRGAGVRGVGFAPKRRTAPRLHAHDEHLNVDVFLQGIHVYVALIKKLGNLPH